jgi:hypothetical protein
MARIWLAMWREGGMWTVAGAAELAGVTKIVASSRLYAGSRHGHFTRHGTSPICFSVEADSTVPLGVRARDVAPGASEGTR